MDYKTKNYYLQVFLLFQIYQKNYHLKNIILIDAKKSKLGNILLLRIITLLKIIQLYAFNLLIQNKILSTVSFQNKDANMPK